MQAMSFSLINQGLTSQEATGLVLCDTVVDQLFRRTHYIIVFRRLGRAYVRMWMIIGVKSIDEASSPQS